MQSLDDARYALLRDVSDLLSGHDFGSHADDPACKAARKIDRDDTGDISPELFSAHWILGAMTEKEVAALARFIEKNQPLESLDASVSNALKLANRTMPVIAREMMFDDVTALGNQVRKLLNQRALDDQSRFSLETVERYLEREGAITVTVDQYGRVDVYDRIAPPRKSNEIVRLTIAPHAEEEQAVRRELSGPAGLRAIDMITDFWVEQKKPTDSDDDIARVDEYQERIVLEEYWRGLVNRFVEQAKKAYAEHCYREFDPESLGAIYVQFEVDGRVTSREVHYSAHHVEHLYALAVSMRSASPHEYVVIESGQPMKCANARFCRSSKLPDGMRFTKRELDLIRWRQFWARPTAWVGPSPQQILAVGGLANGDPEDAPDEVEMQVSHICGVTNRTWRAWSAPNSSQRIPYPAWHLLLVYADLMDHVGRRKMEVANG